MRYAKEAIGGGIKRDANAAKRMEDAGWRVYCKEDEKRNHGAGCNLSRKH